VNSDVEAVEKPKMPKSPLYESISYKEIFREMDFFYSVVMRLAITNLKTAFNHRLTQIKQCVADDLRITPKVIKMKILTH
jgi:hypothetical protein